jgi:hypothetical protein
MLSSPIFDILPIPLFALSILLMLFLHSITAFVIGGVIIGIVCFALYRRLIDVGTEPDVLA